MKKVLVIAGPTASGKSAFAVEAAHEFGGEIISGDSIQVYRGLDIGSGKVTEAEKQGIPHHLIDILSPSEPYSVSDFQRNARACIAAIPFPIIAGGTGLYLKACLYDYTFVPEEETGTDRELEMLDSRTLYERLKETDPISAEKIHPNNRRRVLRALTVAKRSGMAKSEIEAAQKHEPVYDFFIAGCTMDRAVLYERISARVEQMFRNGLEDEVKRLLSEGVTFEDPAMKGIGYREFEPYIKGECSIGEVQKMIAQHSRNYAKRQYTWLNHQMPVHWFNALDQNARHEMMEVIRVWKETENEKEN
ncbi:MAG: tRNA (adenosine(37)-N6)-dimethylallyltransferase MiaA [Solobacterium sp.]|nr:tRNA (adenosine(37)-N6)-dimethylallyltransferase MiaA [Solobacterium sp.]